MFKKLINKILGKFFIKVFSVRHGYGWWMGDYFVYSKNMFGNSNDFCVISDNWSQVDNDVSYASGKSIFGPNGELLTDEDNPHWFNNKEDFRNWLKTNKKAQ